MRKTPKSWTFATEPPWGIEPRPTHYECWRAPFRPVPPSALAQVTCHLSPAGTPPNWRELSRKLSRRLDALLAPELAHQGRPPHAPSHAPMTARSGPGSRGAYRRIFASHRRRRFGVRRAQIRRFGRWTRCAPAVCAGRPFLRPPCGTAQGLSCRGDRRQRGFSAVPCGGFPVPWTAGWPLPGKM
jgi:hypothetical protein